MMEVKFDEQEIKIALKNLSEIPKQAMAGITNAVQDSMLEIQSTAKSPGYVPYKSGNLKRSITQKVEATPLKRVTGTIGSNLEYARIQEFGGVIRPKTGKYLRFLGNNGWVSVKQVTIRPKFYMTRAIKDKLPNLIRRLKALNILKK